jgi:hypothetical protein
MAYELGSKLKWPERHISQTRFWKSANLLTQELGNKYTHRENHKYIPGTKSDFDQKLRTWTSSSGPSSRNSVNNGIPQSRNLRPLRDHARTVHSAYGFLVDADWPSKWVTHTTSPLLF